MPKPAIRSTAVFVALITLAALAAAQRAQFHAWAFSLTGEESTGAQLRGLWQLTGDALRPQLELRADAPIAHADVNPYGINTFLEQEVEPAKREEQVRLISAAGFHWLRQEFPWYDIEIHGKGDFEDRRFEPHRSAWEKYDHIVGLAEQYGIEIVARLSSPPDWTRIAGAAHGSFAPPDDVQDFADYAAAVAERYAGRVNHFQVWNEPNIYPEWGEQAVDPEAYTELLCAAYAAIKQVNPRAVVLAGALAPTAELAERDLNDFVFLERMYAAGAGACFDVMSVQGYGLWSGPTDHRMRPVVVNYARNQFVRDLMVQHGDAHKAIWISEMNWNAVPPDSGLPPMYGQVTLEQQARWAPLAYERAQYDWPWIGVVNFWFFKRASAAEQNQTWYYFRMAEPDFTLLPVYYAMQDYIQSTPPTMYPGNHQEDHWAIEYNDEWNTVHDEQALLGAYRQTTSATELGFYWYGTHLSLITADGNTRKTITVQTDDRPPRTIMWGSDTTEQTYGRRVVLEARLPSGLHHITIRTTAIEPHAPNPEYVIDGFIVRNDPPMIAPMLGVLVIVLVLAWWIARRVQCSVLSQQ